MKPKAGKKTLWSLEAINELRDIYLYIKRDSSAQAIRVKRRLIKEAHSISDFPEKFEVDEFLAGFQKEYRSRTIWSYKIIYLNTPKHVYILKVFHTSRSINSLREGLK